MLNETAVNRKQLPSLILALIATGIAATCAFARPASARVAVAANFQPILEELAAAFEQRHPGDQLAIIQGSTGKLYAQVKAGAPFDLFFAADAQRPALLEKEGLALPDTRFTYAQGRLALWTGKAEIPSDPMAWLAETPELRIAIANPKLAPYGLAAEAFLSAAQLLDQPNLRLIKGESVGQTFHYVRSGAAQAGFVAYSQLLAQNIPATSYWLPDTDSYPAIEQQAVRLTDNPIAIDFIAYIRADAARRQIEEAGYIVP